MYSVVSVWKLRICLRASKRLEEGIYEAEEIENPFLLGILRPCIYLPCGVEENEKSYIIAHEMVHKRRRDYLVKPLFYFAVCLHWFNPLVWMAWILMCKDMEMSCDEAVLGQFGEDTRKEYSTVLLNMAVGNHAFANVPLAFGENDTKARIKNILSYKKPVIWVLVVALLLTGVTAVTLLTNRKSPEETLEALEEQMTVSMTMEEPPEEIVKEAETELSSQAELDLIKAENQRFREMDRNEEMTWDRLKELMTMEQYPTLEDYAGYEGAFWTPLDEIGQAIKRDHLKYVMHDEVTGEDYELTIYYGSSPDDVSYVYLSRPSDRSMLFLYNIERGIARVSPEKIDAFRFNIIEISDWLTWQIPKAEYIKEEGYMADLGENGGELFTWTGKDDYKTNGSESAPEEWKAAGGVMRNSKEFFIFEEGVHTDMYFNYNHSGVTQEAEIVEGCEEQAVIMQMKHDLFTAPELYMAEEAGKPIPENERTVNMWYVGMAREDAKYGYVFFLNARYFDKEDAIAFARSVRFTDNAWVKKHESEADSYNRQARELVRGEKLTFEKLTELAAMENPTLMDYAGYDGAAWSERTGDLANIREDLTYYILDDTDNVYKLYITYYIENNQLEMISLTRQNADGKSLVLYHVQGIRALELDILEFRQNWEVMSDWMSYTVPKAESIEESVYQAGGGYGYGGLYFEWIGENNYTTQNESLNAEMWRKAGGVMRYPLTDVWDGYSAFVFENGKLTDASFHSLNHTFKVGITQQLEGCEEQAVIFKLNHDLFTASDVAEAQAAGNPIPEDEQTSNIWYVAFAREDAPYGYVVYLNERYYNKEDVIAFAQSVRFTEEAWK